MLTAVFTPLTPQQQVLPDRPGTANKAGTVVTVAVNDKATAAAAAVRGERDAYGRAMTPFRRSHTKKDAQPLPLRGEDRKAEEWRQRRRAGKEAKSRNTASRSGCRSGSIGKRK